MTSRQTAAGEGRITVSRYEEESEMGVIMSLIDEELSEPYTVYTYRYFLNQWPQLCFLAHVGSASPRKTVGVIICKLDRHLKGNRYMRGYIGMLSVQPTHRGKGIATRLLKVALAELVNLGAQEVRCRPADTGTDIRPLAYTKSLIPADCA
jgi:peptide alpha-N-acetyltransferase